MNKKSGSSKASADKLVKNIRRKARQICAAEDTLRSMRRDAKAQCFS